MRMAEGHADARSGPRDAQPLRGRAVRHDVSRQQHHPRPRHQPERRRGPARQTLQLSAFSVAKADEHKAWMARAAVVQPGTCGMMAKSPESAKTSLRQRVGCPGSRALATA